LHACSIRIAPTAAVSPTKNRNRYATMSGMGGSPFGSAHQDVLGQTPTDPEAKQKLVDEIKDRARKAFGRRDMPVCEALYSKALKVLPDAPLYSNRSAVRLALGRFDDAFADATSCTETDPAYPKGYYRLGQAGEKCGKFGEAKKAYEKGQDLEPASKVWPGALAKLEQNKKAYEAKPKKREAAPDLLAPRTAQPIGEAGKTTKKANPSLRGYKVDSQGRKTTFFNNELSEEAKALIGDIAPKKVTEPTQMKVGAGESSWNQAGTFESKDHTKWLRGWLETKFRDFMVDLPERQVGALSVPCYLTVKKIKEIKGDASTAQARGKKKWVLDVSFVVEWEFPLDDAGAVAKGTMLFPDVSCDVIDDDEPLEWSLDVDPLTPKAAIPLITSHLQSDDVGLRPAVREACAGLVAEFRATK
jgi:hypothetical protein